MEMGLEKGSFPQSCLFCDNSGFSVELYFNKVLDLQLAGHLGHD